MSLALTLALSPALAYDIDTLTEALNGSVGSEVISPTSAHRLRPSTLEARLDGAIVALEALGCSVDPDHVWYGTTSGLTSSGVDENGAEVQLRFYKGRISGVRDPLGDAHTFSGSYTNVFSAAASVSDGSTVVAVQARISGGRSIWYGMRGTGCDAEAAKDAWLTTRHHTTCIADGAERCDGVDNDCDGSTDPEGLATFFDGDGVAHDWSDAFPSDGLVLDEPGTLALCEGTYKGSLQVTSDVTVRGTGDATLSGGGTLRPLYVDGTALVLEGLDVASGSADDGGCIRLSSGSSLLATDVTLRSCAASNDGGGIYATDAEIDLYDTQLEDCTAGHQGAGAWLSGGTLSLLESTVARNTAVHHGGGVYAAGVAVDASGSTFQQNDGRTGGALRLQSGSTGVFTDTSVVENVATFRGGGIYLDDGSLTLADVTIQGNRSGTYGGGLRVSDATLGMERVQLTGNESSTGGGMFAQNIAGTLMDCDFTSNTATGATTSVVQVGGGGMTVFGDSTVQVTGGRFEGNQATTGGAIRTDQGTLTMNGTTITGNSIIDHDDVQSRGAALNADGSTVELTDVTLSGHYAERGGAIWSNGHDITLTGGALTDNSAEDGGAVWYQSSSRTLTLEGVEIGRNTATSRGGIVYLGQGTLDVQGGTLFENTASQGGAVWVESSSATLTVTDATVRDHVASDAALAVYGATVTNTTFQDNTASDVLNRATSTSFDFGANAAFTCDASGCD